MASITRAYFVGSSRKNNEDKKELDSVGFVFLRGDGNRIWYESNSTKSPFTIQKTIPKGPDDPNQILDALIVFHGGSMFSKCNSFEKIQEELKDLETLDFDLSSEKIPKNWKQFRQEAKEKLEQSNTYVLEFDIFNQTSRRINF